MSTMNIMDFLLSPVGLGIIAGIVAASAIAIFLVRSKLNDKNRTIKDLSVKIKKQQVSKIKKKNTEKA
jgi:hypothetical protein